MTNVLEGVELLEKITKNYVRWTPHRLEAESYTSLDVERLRKEIIELEVRSCAATSGEHCVNGDV